MDPKAIQFFLSDATDSLAAALEEQALLEAQLQDKRDEIKNLQDEIEGLSLTAKRLGVAIETSTEFNNVIAMPGHGSPSHGDMPHLCGMNRTDAVAAVLEFENRPLERSRILDLALYGDADFDHADQVSLALTNLKRSGRVEKLGDGRWRLVNQSRLSQP